MIHFFSDLSGFPLYHFRTLITDASIVFSFILDCSINVWYLNEEVLCFDTNSPENLWRAIFGSYLLFIYLAEGWHLFTFELLLGQTESSYLLYPICV